VACALRTPLPAGDGSIEIPELDQDNSADGSYEIKIAASEDGDARDKKLAVRVCCIIMTQLCARGVHGWRTA